jgi:hypothetical protein
MKKSTLILFLLAVTAGAAVWYFEFYRQPEEKPPSAGLAFAFTRDDVMTILIHRGDDALTLERRGDAWRMTSPLDSATDASAVDAVLSSLTSARVERRFPATPEKLKEFELNAPRVSLEVKLKSGASHRVAFGANDFSNSNTYVLLDDAKEVSFIARDLLAAVDKPVLEFRDRRIAVFSEANLVRLRVRNKNTTLVAEKKDDKWLVHEPAAKKDWELMTWRIFNTLESAKATEILDAPKPAIRARLAKPEVEAELTDKDGQTLRVSVATAGKDEIYSLSSASPSIYKVESSTLESLNFKLDDVLREPEKPKAETKGEKNEEKKEEPAKAPAAPPKKP